jgi:predicted O-linked N-acetylglucosamine transferase (SPINDLY family)
MSESILRTMGMPELILGTLVQYEERVIAIANNPNYLKEIKDKIAVNLQTSHLFNTDLYTRNLEALYGKMWEIYAGGEKPRQIEASKRMNPVKMKEQPELITI